MVTDNLLIRSTNQIKNYFTKKGYLDADVDIKQQKDTTRANHIVLIFDINKNNRIKINEINVSGNKGLNTEGIKKGTERDQGKRQDAATK